MSQLARQTDAENTRPRVPVDLQTASDLETGASARRLSRPLRSGGTADDLQIAGLVPMSGVDWPGHLVATVFAQGCPWACPYCQNVAIIDPIIPGVVAWQSVEDLLARRHGLLDGVVFSGGEPTRQQALVPAAQRVRDLGFQVGIHTGGAYPMRVRQMLDLGLIDWVGLDIKAMPEDYGQVVGPAAGGAKAWSALDMLLADPHVDVEVRMTVYPAIPGNPVDVARAVYSRGARTFALQQARSLGTPEGFQASRPGWNDEVRQMADDISTLGFDHFEFRAA